MAKIADLLIQLSVDSASLKTSFESSRKDVQKFSNDISSSFTTMRNIVTGALGAIGVSLSVDFAKQVLESADAVGKLSQKVGISTEYLSGLQYAAKLSDVEFDTLAKGLKKFNINIQEAISGSAEQRAAFAAVGISIADLKSKKPEELFDKFSDSMAGFRDGSAKTALAAKILGDKLGPDLIPLLNGGSSGIGKLRDDARAMGKELSGADAAGVERFNDDLTRMQEELDGATRQILIGFLPAASHIVETLTQVTDRTSAMREFGRILGEAFQTATKWALALKLAVQEMFIAVSASFQQINEAPLWRKLIPGGILYDFFRVNPKTEDEVNRVFDAYKKLIDELDRAQSKPSLARQLFGSDADFSKGIEALNQQFPIKKREAPSLPDAGALAKAAAAAKKYAEEYKRAFEEIQRITSAGILAGANDVDAPFVKASQQLREGVDKIAEDLSKFPQLVQKGPQRIGGFVVGAVTDYLNQIDKIGDEAKDKIDEILGKVGQLRAIDISNIPIVVPTTLPTLAGNDFYTNFIRSLTANKKTLQGELNNLLGVQQFKASIDEVILETRKASAGIGVFFRQYADYATNAAKVFHDAFAKVFGALEDQLTNLLAHFKFDFKSFLDTIKESIARATVQKFILGPIAKTLGKALGLDLVKADGSKDSPFHVIVENGGGLFGGIGGGSSDSGDSGDSGDGESSGGVLGKIQSGMGKIFSAIGSFFQKIGSAILSAFKFIGGAIAGLFGGFKADGGDVFSGKAYVVGERGPEIFAPGRSGTIIPNHALGGGRQANITNNFYLTPTRSDPFGYSESQLANATFTGLARGMART